MAILAGAAGQAAMSSATTDGGLFNRALKLILILILLIIVVAIIVALVIIVDNWEAITVWFTTGFIGWLNPFDDDEGDVNPDAAVGATSTFLTLVFPWYRVATWIF